MIMAFVHTVPIAIFQRVENTPEQHPDDGSVKPRTLECALGAQSATLGRLAQIILQQLPRSLFGTGVDCRPRLSERPRNLTPTPLPRVGEYLV